MPYDAHTSVRHAHRARNKEKIEKENEKQGGNAPDDSAAENGQDPNPQNLTFLQRLKHFTWAWYTVSMSTGGMALVIGQLPFEFKGRREIGVAIYIFNLVLFAIISSLLLTRFVVYRKTLRNSFLHPTENLFIPCFLVSIGVLLTGGGLFGLEKAGEWWIISSRVIYWLYCAMAVVWSSGTYLTIWATTPHTISSMTPTWIFPIYPCLLMGPITAVIAPWQPAPHNIRMLVAGVSVQGIGFLIALMVYAAYISRLMTDKLPHASHRPGMYISVGPSAFTVIAMVGMGRVAIDTDALGTDFGGVEGEIARSIVRVVSVWLGAWLWGLALWFFIVTTAAHVLCIWNRKLHFKLNWWSFLFPNTALTIATYRIGESFNAPAIQYLGAVFACLLVLFWFFVFTKMLLAVKRKEILWPDKDEDRSEGGFNADSQQVILLEDDRVAVPEIK